MKTVNVLVVVDVEGALAGSLGDNVYLVDTNKHFGSSGEGQEGLSTACRDGQLVAWNVVPVSPSNDVQIAEFTGQIINNGTCVPKLVSTPDGDYWEGRVEARGTTGYQQYSLVLAMDGTRATFDPWLLIKE
ncbi:MULTISPECIES: hypothetical protein [unclassified Parafrankia]|uniref:alpha-pore-forming tripartite toxin MakABE regulator n=1 Tax=unclassified Parafrankia TaxID=2994368 RepID=UPI000DA5C331|nr:MULTISPECIES: hypothetical protein [unclassified Parafrankia]TCJ35230.1 hypothetical protein E0504_29075 [Parafrankia sp. BMG5.11]SQD93961.1 conserved hypothetical protein [Parafrankia sp. Ea1.12]